MKQTSIGIYLLLFFTLCIISCESKNQSEKKDKVDLKYFEKKIDSLVYFKRFKSPKEVNEYWNKLLKNKKYSFDDELQFHILLIKYQIINPDDYKKSQELLGDLEYRLRNKKLNLNYNKVQMYILTTKLLHFNHEIEIDKGIQTYEQIKKLINTTNLKNDTLIYPRYVSNIVNFALLLRQEDIKSTKALEMLKEANYFSNKISEKNNLYYHKSITLLNLGCAYIDLASVNPNKYPLDSALAYFNESLIFINKKKHFPFLFLAKMCIAEINFEKKQYPEAISNTESAKLIAEKLQYDDINPDLLLMKIYAELKQFEKSNIYFNNVLNNITAIKKNKENIIKNNEQDLKKILNYAIEYKKYDQLKFLSDLYTDELEKKYTKDKAQAFKDAEVKYEVQAKNDKIALLNAENKAKEEKSSRNFYLFLASLLLLLSGGLVVYFRNRQKKTEEARLKAEYERELSEHARSKADEQRKKVELEQRLLLSQMNPHFMQNAMGAIQNEMYLGHYEIAEKTMAKFTTLTNMILNNSRQNYISIKEELKLLKLYLDLQKIRFENKFDYSFEYEISDEDEHTFIPPMLIQPFVENALEHGFSGIDYQGKIIIRLEKKEDYLVCVVDDNGIGERKKEYNSEKKSHATPITKERLEILSAETGKKANLEIRYKNTPDTGVNIELTIPILEE